jgi:hypothetical protein
MDAEGKQRPFPLDPPLWSSFNIDSVHSKEHDYSYFPHLHVDRIVSHFNAA